MKSIFKQKLLCETACGHDGKLGNLLKLIKIAKKCGAQNIKFQIFKTWERALPNTKEWKIFSKLELTDTEWKKSIEFSKKNKLKVFADIYGNDSFNISNELNVDGFKIHSEDFFNTYFIQKVLERKKPVLLSVGGTYRSELYELVSWLFKKKKLNKNTFLVPGIQIFPTPLKDHYINEIIDLKNKYTKFGVKVGYADHISGDDPISEIFPFMALSAGADFVEKHFTDSRKFKRTDYHSALDQKQLNLFINTLNNLDCVFKKLGPFSINENKYRKMFKKTIVLSNDKFIKDKIDAREINFVKNTTVSSSLFSHTVTNKKVIRKLIKTSPLNLKYINQNIGAIIVVRLNSNRFPDKALKKINGVPAIILLIRRLKKIKSLNSIILATSLNARDKKLKKFADMEKINFFQGPLTNVAKRYYLAAKKFKLDQIVRITGDAILVDELMLTKAIESQIKNNSDVTFIKNMPYGTAKEIMNFKTIKVISQKSKKKNNTEYLEWFLENSRNFRVNYIKSDYIFDKKIRLTLDFKEDLVLFDKIFRYFKDKQADFILKDVIKLLKKKKSMIKINSFLTPKFKKNDINTEIDI